MADGDDRVPLGAAGPLGWTPVPDPTKLTTDAVDKAKAELRQLIDERWEQAASERANLRQIIEARILALENDAELRLDNLREVRPQTERQIRHLRELMDEKFAGIEQRFHDRDARAADVSAAGKDALAAAFESAKELSNLVAEQFKSEILALRTAADERAKSQDQQFQALKERIDRGDQGGYGQGESAQKDQTRQGYVLALGALGFLVTVLGVAFAIYAATHR